MLIYKNCNGKLDNYEGYFICNTIHSSKTIGQKGRSPKPRTGRSFVELCQRIKIVVWQAL